LAWVVCRWWSSPFWLGVVREGNENSSGMAEAAWPHPWSVVVPTTCRHSCGERCGDLVRLFVGCLDAQLMSRGWFIGDEDCLGGRK